MLQKIIDKFRFVVFILGHSVANDYFCIKIIDLL